nr:HIRAN domain-containing protein [Clostridia bacterium]
MKNELSKTNTNQIALMDNKELSDIIKPLSKEIHLFDSFVSGTLKIKDQEILKNIKPGDKLILQREESVFDSNTINIFTEDKVKIGYVPEKDNVIFARLMDAGKLLIGRVNSVSFKSSIPVISVGIFMIDY